MHLGSHPTSQKIQTIERIMKVEEVGSKAFKAFVFDLAVVGGWSRWLVAVPEPFPQQL